MSPFFAFSSRDNARRGGRARVPLPPTVVSNRGVSQDRFHKIDAQHPAAASNAAFAPQTAPAPLAKVPAFAPKSNGYDPSVAQQRHSQFFVGGKEQARAIAEGPPAGAPSVRPAAARVQFNIVTGQMY